MPFRPNTAAPIGTTVPCGRCGRPLRVGTAEWPYADPRNDYAAPNGAPPACRATDPDGCARTWLADWDDDAALKSER